MNAMLKTLLATLVLLFSTNIPKANENEARLQACRTQLSQVVEHCSAEFSQQNSPEHSLCVEAGMHNGTVGFTLPFDFGRSDTDDPQTKPYRCYTAGDRMMKLFEIKLREKGSFRGK